MTLFQALILGLVQGLTEFVPVSSSAHLVLVPWALNWPSPGLTFDTVLHWGTLVAVLAYFWRDWVQMGAGFFRSLVQRGPWSVLPGGRLADLDSRLAWWVVIGSVPAAVIGYALKDFFEGLFSNPMAVAGSLLITALILAIGERLGRRVQAIGQNPLGQIRLLDAWLVGLAQAVAIAPGISRSGATIAAGLSLGLQRDVAARFSFLLSAPAVFGAGLVQLVDLIQTDNLAAEWLQLLVGFLVAAVTGFLCIHFLLAYLRRGKLYVFAGYCAFIGLGTLIATYLLNDPG